MIFFFNDTATTEIYTLSLHDALPILFRELQHRVSNNLAIVSALLNLQRADIADEKARQALSEAAQRLQLRSEEHTSELQSRQYLVCRLLLEKKKQTTLRPNSSHAYIS